MIDRTQRKLEHTQHQLQRINDDLERWHRTLTRAVNKINKLRKARDALLRPRKLKDFETETISGAQWHAIRHNENLNKILDDRIDDV